jgi:dethiobiotin synthetase
MSVLVISGTNTDVGKTVVTAAVAALAAQQRRVAVMKPVQTGVAPGEDADLAQVARLAGPSVTLSELARFSETLAPNTAARRAGAKLPTVAQIADEVRQLAATHDLVLVEGAGGVLAWLDDRGATLVDVARALNAPVVVVAAAGLGTLNATALTAEVLRHRGARSLGVVIGSFPAEPDLATRCNLVDLEQVSSLPLLGVLPSGLNAVSREDFLRVATDSLGPALGGRRDVPAFQRSWA